MHVAEYLKYFKACLKLITEIEDILFKLLLSICFNLNMILTNLFLYLEANIEGFMKI
jgi:hypothetical protein